MLRGQAEPGVSRGLEKIFGASSGVQPWVLKRQFIVHSGSGGDSHSSIMLPSR
ncbi:MAG TPA: hypothetical protein VHY08_28640 [Bacillota bacterium]|nr:hypothetical protein [Bacillota bacterium]